MEDTPKMGRPSIYSDVLADKICEELSSGLSMRDICKREDMPAQATVYEWLNDNAKSYFSEQYTKARAKQAEHLFEEILEIADDGTNDWMENHGEEDSGWRFNGEHYQRSRLRIDTRKWYLSKVLPKKYADTTKLEHTGKDGDPIKVDVTGNIIVFKQFDETDSKPSI